MIDTTKEAQLTLESIRADIRGESAKLSALYAEAAQIQTDKTAFSGEKVIWQKKVETEEAAMASERAEIARSREQMRLEEIWHQKSIIELKQQEKLSLKDLSWVNDKILKADELIKEKQTELKNIEVQVVKQQELIIDVSDLILQVDDLQEQRNKTLGETELVKANASAYLLKMQQELEVVLEQRDLALVATDKAQIELRDYISELFIKREDFKVYVYRLEKHCQKEFPELKIIL